MSVRKTIIFVLTFAALLTRTTVSLGQNAITSEQLPTDSLHFQFVYIDLEPTSPVNDLCQRIIKVHNNAVEMGDKLIIYMPNEDEPFISFTNLSDPDATQHRDSLDAFYAIVDELQDASYHDVNVKLDNDTIKKLIGIDGAFPIFRERRGEGKMTYKSVTLNFYVGQRFWALRYNEELIAQLFISLQIPTYMQKYPYTQLAFNVLKPTNDQISHPEGKPFGLKNLGGINEKIRIQEY